MASDGNSVRVPVFFTVFRARCWSLLCLKVLFLRLLYRPGVHRRSHYMRNVSIKSRLAARLAVQVTVLNDDDDDDVIMLFKLISLKSSPWSKTGYIPKSVSMEGNKQLLATK